MGIRARTVLIGKEIMVVIGIEVILETIEIHGNKKMWHMYTMEYYSAIKRNEIELFVVRWMDIETVIQSEVSQKEKNKYCMLTDIYGI